MWTHIILYAYKHVEIDRMDDLDNTKKYVNT